jgi:hypothetical protein
MPKTPDRKIALVALIAFAAWLFIGLPLLYLPSQDHVHGEILGVKYGEWLLFLATMALFWATWRLVKGAERTAERQLRAYVHISAARAIQVGAAINYYVEAKNFGQTPAYNVRLRYMVKLREVISSEPFSLPEGAKASAATLAPGTPMHDEFTPNQMLGPNQLLAIKSGSKAIYIFGVITYDDIFNTERTTKFRYMLDGEVGPSNDGALRICADGNEAN